MKLTELEGISKGSSGYSKWRIGIHYAIIFYNKGKFIWLYNLKLLSSKYENGEVDAGVKSVVALCKLYNVPYDVILENKLSNKESVTYKIKEDFDYNLSVESPSPVYSASSLKSETNQKAGYYYNQILSQLPHLVYSEELDLLSKLAKKVEIQTEKIKIENHAKNISEKDAEILFEHFSGMGQGLDFETEKNS